jgi:hypothetical protein
LALTTQRNLFLSVPLLLAESSQRGLLEEMSLVELKARRELLKAREAEEVCH